MKRSMTIEEFVTNCLKYGFTFEMIYMETPSDDEEPYTYDEYYLHMILGNLEYLIPYWDQEGLARLWYKDLLKYHIY